MRNPTRIRRELEAIYAKLPEIDCKGLCDESCGPIDMSATERRAIEARTGRSPDTVPGCLDCNMLLLGRCSVYDIRPMICRMWGVVEGMRCPFGCEPEGGLMPHEEAMPLLAETLEIGGRPPGWDPIDVRRIAEMVRDPANKQFLQNFVETGMRNERRRGERRKKL